MQTLTVAQAVNRGINFFAIAVYDIIGIGAIHEVINEDDPEDKMEDELFVVSALLALVWYKLSGKAMKRTLIPGYFLLIGILIKLIGIGIEYSDKLESSPDIAYIGILGTTLLIFLYQYYKFRDSTH